MFVLQDLDFGQLEKAVSTERLTSYGSLAGAGAGAQLGAYLWGLELSAAFGPLLSVTEVALRNAIHTAASSQFGRADWIPIVLRHAGDRQWLSEVGADATLATKKFRSTASAHNKKTLTVGTDVLKLAPWKSPSEEKFEGLKSSLTKKGVPHQAQNLVANAMLGFWVDLFDASFVGTRPTQDLWPTAIPSVFPNLGSTKFETIATDLRLILGLRNRTYHHEPIWRVGSNTTPLKAETQLSALIAKFERILAAMSTDLHTALCRTGFIPRLKWLASVDAIDAFATCALPAMPGAAQLDEAIRDVLSMVATTPLPPAVLRPDRAIALGTAGAPSALLVPLNGPVA